MGGREGGREGREGVYRWGGERGCVPLSFPSKQKKTFEKKGGNRKVIEKKGRRRKERRRRRQNWEDISSSSQKCLVKRKEHLDEQEPARHTSKEEADRDKINRKPCGSGRNKRAKKGQGRKTVGTKTLDSSKQQQQQPSQHLFEIACKQANTAKKN